MQTNQNFSIMKKIIVLLSLVSLAFSCSSSDDSNDDDGPMDPVIGHYTLRVNGNGYSDERFEMFRDSIEHNGNNVKYRASDNNFNSLYISLPTPIEINTQYSIAPYNINNTSVASLIISGDGIYLSEDGNVFFNEIVMDDGCVNYSGNFSINYRRQDNTPGNINVQGSFDVPTYACEMNN